MSYAKEKLTEYDRRVLLSTDACQCLQISKLKSARRLG